MPSDTAAAYCERGRTSFVQQEYAQAVDDLTQAIDLDHSLCDELGESAFFSAAYYLRGRAWQKLAESAKALADFRQALEYLAREIDAALFAQRTRKGEAVSGKEDVRAAQDKYANAIADITNDIAQDPTHAFAYLVRGLFHAEADFWFGNRQYDEAFADFTKAIELEPLYGPAYYERGKIWRSLRDYAAAIADFTKGISLAPHLKDEYRDNICGAYSWRAQAWEEKQDFDKAIADFTTLIELFPNDDDAYQGRGRLQPDCDAAIADFTKAIELSPTWYWYYTNRGRMWHEKKVYDKAIADFTKAIDLQPNAEAYCERGRVWYANQAFEKAYADYTKAIELGPKEADYGACGYAHYLRGFVSWQNREYSKAIADFTEAIQFFTRMYDLHVFACKSGQWKQAPEAVEHHPHEGDAYYNRGVLWLATRQRDKALADFAKAIELDVDIAPQVWSSLGVAGDSKQQ
jgi:tetratricopeptide (TPR) repeat protein